MCGGLKCLIPCFSSFRPLPLLLPFQKPLMQGAVPKPPFSFRSLLSTHRARENNFKTLFGPVLPLFKLRGIIIPRRSPPQKFKWGCSLTLAAAAAWLMANLPCGF